MKICTVLGARPQFIKAAVVSRALKSYPEIQEVIIHTGQHYDHNMSECFFDELHIPKPEHQLSIGSGHHGAQTGQMLEAIEKVLQKEKPDLVLVYGDTNSTLAGGLAAVKLHIPIVHVEAGLRSFNRCMPEEINRLLVDEISQILFAPTQIAHQHLIFEHVPQDRVFNVGDVMLDATIFYNKLNENRKTVISQLNLLDKRFVLVTIHRAENTDDATRMNHILEALLELAEDMQVVWPVHPRTQVVLAQHPLYKQIKAKLNYIDPVGYLDMLALEAHAECIITDSGGVQKEAYFNQVPCITLRDETEWVELVELGWNQLCSPSQSFSLKQMLLNPPKAQPFSAALFGDGSAGARIAKQLYDYAQQFEYSISV